MIWNPKIHWLLSFVLLCSILMGCQKQLAPNGSPQAPIVAEETGFAGHRVGADGTNSSGGGDVFAQEFKDLALEIIQRLQLRDLRSFGGVDIKKFRELVRQTEIHTTERPLYHPNPSAEKSYLHPFCLDTGSSALGAEIISGKDSRVRVDAINCPNQRRILLSLINWRSELSLLQKQRLVLHEFLGLMRIADQNYSRSLTILRRLNLTSTFKIPEFVVTGPFADTLISAIHWAPSEMGQIRPAPGMAENGIFIHGKSYILKSHERVLLECEAGEMTDGANTAKPPSSCKLYLQSEIQDGNRLMVYMEKDEELFRQRLFGEKSERTHSRIHGHERWIVFEYDL